MRTCTLYYGMFSQRHAYWETDTMYLDGINSLCLPYRYLDDVDFCASHVKLYNFKLVKRVV